MTDRHSYTPAQLARLVIQDIAETIRVAEADFNKGDENAAWGGLLKFEESAQELLAIIRLRQASNRRRKS